MTQGPRNTAAVLYSPTSTSGHHGRTSKAGTTVSDVSYVNGRGATTTTDGCLEVAAAPGFSAIAEITVCDGAVSGIAVSSDGGRLMATHFGDDSVSLIATDSSGNRPAVRSVADVGEPFAISMADTAAGRAYVSTVSTAYDSILTIDVDTNRVVATHPVAHRVTDLVVSPDGRQVYASRNAVNGADVAVLDTQTGRDDAIGIAATPGTSTECVRVSPDGQRLYVAANGPSAAELVVIDARQKHVVNTVQIGSAIRDVAVSADGATAYVASCAPDFGVVLDIVDTRANMVDSTHKIGEIAGCLTQLTLSRDGERAYLVSDESVTVLDTLTRDVIGTIGVDSQPSCVVESPDGSRLYIGDYAGTVTVLAIESAAHDEPTAPGRWAPPELVSLAPAIT
jgi:YVTN family beta-propeller protein